MAMRCGAVRCGTQVASRALNKEGKILSAHDHWREGVALPFFGSFLVSVRAVQEIVFVPFADNAAEVVVFFLEIQAVSACYWCVPEETCPSGTCLSCLRAAQYRSPSKAAWVTAAVLLGTPILLIEFLM